MLEKSFFATLLFAIFCTSYIESVPFVKKCKSDDSKCIKESAQAVIPIFAAGLPEYGVKILDPMSLAKVDASTPTLKYILTDITVKGLKNCIAKKMQRDKSKSKLFVKLLCSIDVDSNYEMKGQLLILPIEGNGLMHVKLRNIEINADVNLEQGEYLKITSYEYSYELKDKSEIMFENLFNGNEVLASAAREVIANSGNEVIMEIGPPVIKAVVGDILKTIKAFFKSVPASELSID